MFICICHAVTDDELGRAIDDGAKTIAELSAATRAGGSCGTCHEGIEDLIELRCGTCPLAALQVA